VVEIHEQNVVIVNQLVEDPQSITDVLIGRYSKQTVPVHLPFLTA